MDRYSLETSRPKFYAGGDLITGASNVSNAMGYGKKAARNIDERLMGVRRFAQLFREIECENTAPSQPSDSRRHAVSDLVPLERVQTFEEATLGLAAVEAMEESSRCLRCDVRNGDH